MIVCISYGDKKYNKTKRVNLKSAKVYGADRVIGYGPRDIDKEFYNEHISIFSQKRGNGYWLWKPYVILKTLENIQDGDICVYSDAGSFYINDVHELVAAMNNARVDIMPFSLTEKERIYSKRDAFILMDADTQEIIESMQRLGGFQVIRKTAQTVKFVQEWLKYCCDERIITDISNTLGKDNYPGFIENRHDQTVFSLLSKKYGSIAFRDPSQFGNDITEYDSLIAERSTYPQIWECHRCSDLWSIRLYYWRKKRAQNKMQ